MVIRLFNSIRIADHDSPKIPTRYFRETTRNSSLLGNNRSIEEEPSGSFGSFEHVIHLIQQADINFLEHEWNEACARYTHASKILETIPASHEEHLRYCSSQLAYLHFRLFHWKEAMKYYVRSLEDTHKADPVEDQSRDLMKRIAAARRGNAPLDDDAYKPSCSWHH